MQFLVLETHSHCRHVICEILVRERTKERALDREMAEADLHFQLVNELITVPVDKLDLDKVLADLGEEKSKPKGQKAAGGSGSSLKKKSSSQVSKTRADSTEEQAATPSTSSQQQQQQVCSLTQFFLCRAGYAHFLPMVSVVF